jgi:apolipoprotein D and lipocalin family protein
MRRWLLGVVLALVACGCASRPPEGVAPLRTVPSVDLARYLGQWFEIARYPHRFQEGCVASTATYSWRDDGRIRVINECREAGQPEKRRRAEGVAWVVEGEPSNAKLQVQFFWPFRGDYWIIELDPDYQYAVVGHPSREYLWILARTPRISASLYEELRRRIAAHGYDPARLQPSPHN